MHWIDNVDDEIDAIFDVNFGDADFGDVDVEVGTNFILFDLFRLSVNKFNKLTTLMNRCTTKCKLAAIKGP